MPPIRSTQIFAAARARQRAAALYLHDPLISLIDVGMRIKERDNKQIIDELAVRVHLRRKLRGAAFEAFAIRNPQRVVTAEQIGFPVDIVEANYQLHQFRTRFPAPQTIRARVHEPMQGGISISNAWDRNYGTLGGRVIDRETGAEMILSAWHVLASSGYAQPGLKIYQPGYADGGTARYTVAQLTRHAMDQGIDAAVAQLTGFRPLSNSQLGLGVVNGVAQPILGMRVTKSGRTSNITDGIIDGIDGVTTIIYRGFSRVIRHVVHIAQTAHGAEVSAPGDSGAFWLEKNTLQAAALHFAGDNFPEYGLALSMPHVLDALNVDI
ncbi:MAG: hypothetical protein ACFE0I_23995 [Elainellaceae cyanobacterium]